MIERWRTMAREIIKNKQAMLGIVMILIVVTVAIFAPFIAPNNPNDINTVIKFAPAGGKYPLGTDQLGRCVLSRLVYGARYSLGIAVPTLMILAAISMILGTFAAYVGGKLDHFFSIVCNIFMAFPPLVVVLSLAGVIGQGILNIIVSVVLSMWVWFVKVIRSYVLIEKGKEYVTSAHIAGSSDFKIIIKHILPNILPMMIVYFSTSIAALILMVSGYSFLGIGIDGNVPEWGSMLSSARSFLYSNPKLVLYPGFCILFTAAGFNLFGEALRDIITPDEV
jgi:ABC-type dipeptide/oligopeptide/nickel transport system permease subunit